MAHTATLAGLKRVSSSRAHDGDATLIEIEASVATPDEMVAANNLFRA
jgi:hypothetical protein